MRILERKDIVRSLRIEVEKAGSQSAWAEKHGPDRSYANGLRGKRRPAETIIKALELRIVVVSDQHMPLDGTIGGVVGSFDMLRTRRLNRAVRRACEAPDG